MVERKEPSQELLLGRRALEGIKECTLLHDLAWDSSIGRWALNVRLSVDVNPDGSFPQHTNWYFVIAPEYPSGAILLFPAQENGITQTFHHQLHNQEQEEFPWRTGEVCLKSPAHDIGRQGETTEPIDAQRRLVWYVERAIEWLCRAADGSLIKPGEPFELPQYPAADSNRGHVIVAFSESTESYARWVAVPSHSGLVQFSGHRYPKTDLYVIQEFKTLSGHLLVDYRWGTGPSSGQQVDGIWIRLDQVPALSPWQAPSTWGELRTACLEQGINLNERMESVCMAIRDRSQHTMMIGFPIPEYYAQPVCQLHWLAIRLPILASGSKKVMPGFRPDHGGYWRYDLQHNLVDNAPIDWVETENWHQSQISRRGRLSEQVCARRIALIGVGALGSVIAHLLVRAGAREIVLVDGDKVEAGNLVRHTLMIDTIETNKAEALAEQLRLASPHIAIIAICNNFPPLTDGAKESIRACDMIIDCTGSDNILPSFATFDWGEKKLFISLSLGYNAQRLFCFSAVDSSFPYRTMLEMLRPLIERERASYTDKGFPWEGAGCWHPLFPARIDDIWLLGSVALKYIDEVATDEGESTTPSLAAFEQYSDEGYAGVRRVTSD